MKIESSDKEIRDLLSSGYYKIPRFQRPYSWTEDNIQDFWDDVVRDESDDYFIGSMVLYKEGDQRFGVVDGQQRLTTIVILLGALRDTLSDLDFDDFAQGIQTLIERKNIDNKPEFVLSTESSYPFFQDHILKFGQPDVDVQGGLEEDTLRSAYDKLRSLINRLVDEVKERSQLPEKRRVDLKTRLLKVRDALLNLKVIVVNLDNEDDAYIIFETLNTRGKDLSLTDLVKNHVSKHLRAQNASFDQAKVKWEGMLSTLHGSDDVPNSDVFIHHFWLSRYEYLPAKTLFKTIRKRVNRSKAKAFLGDLVLDAERYREIHDVDWVSWKSHELRIRNAFKALQLFRVQQPTPCLLSLLRAYRQKHIKRKGLETALVAIEKFHFLFTAITSQRSSGGISGMYARLGREMFDAAGQDERAAVIRELQNMLRDRVPSEDEFMALFPKVIYAGKATRHRNLVRYILETFYRECNALQGMDFASMTIEHLLPQSKIGEPGVDDELVGQLGNLVLVSGPANSRLGDKSFPNKKEIIVEAGIRLPNDVMEATEWGPDQILERTRRMGAQAYNEHWRV